MYIKSCMTKKNEHILSRDRLIDLYERQHKTMREICEITGVKARETVSKYLRKYGIKIRDINAERENKTMMGMDKEEFKQFLLDMYIDQKMSLNQISYELKVSSRIVKKYLIRFGATVLDHKNANSFFNSVTDGAKWKNSSGYIEIVCRNHPYKSKRNTVYEHRLIMEKHLGRHLTKEEVIHHINGIKDDNSIENLELTSNSLHIANHHKKEKKLNPFRYRVEDGYWDKIGRGCCKICGTTKIKHKCHGICLNCYARERKNGNLEKYLNR